MRRIFDDVADRLARLVRGGEIALVDFVGESTDFIRFNRGRVRQPGSVEQRHAEIELIDGRRHAEVKVALGGHPDDDGDRVEGALSALREQIALVPEDPHLLYDEEPRSSETILFGTLPPSTEVPALVAEAASGSDLVGIYAAGAIHRGFASTLGHRHWHSVESFNFDFSLHLRADKAVKAGYAGFEWSPAELARRVERARTTLEIMARSPVSIPPGRYRAFLAPAAIHELLGFLAWGSFGKKSQATKQSSLVRLIEGKARFSERFSLSEDHAGGVAPRFQGQGFLRPDRVPLVEGGRYAGCLVSPRSAKEYGVPSNGAAASEMPTSLAIAPGGLAMDAVPGALGDGLHIGNLWYTNYSDRAACRVTGMTRFATLWYEGGEPVGPVEVMRFDDSMFRLFGDALVDLTTERELTLDPESYGARALTSTQLPGALVSSMSFTL